MKNYSSSVPVERTISKIEQALAKAGALSVHKEFESGQTTAVSFTLQGPGDRGGFSVRLPANIEAVERVLLGNIKRPRKETIARIKAQAARTAWKVILDWVEVQLSLIEMGQAEALQVFLPYIWYGGRTLYAAIKDSGFKMLPEGKK